MGVDIGDGASNGNDGEELLTDGSERRGKGIW